ncbi:MAG: LPS-assembly protein LptD, partial [Burkholderiales bacterium]
MLAQTVAAEDLERPSPALKPAPSFDVAIPGASGNNDAVVFIRADSITNQTDVEMNADGNAEVRRRGVVLTADHIRYQQQTQTVEATGNVRLVRNNALTVEGPHSIYGLDDHQGYMETPTFSYPPSDLRPWAVRGDARLMEFVAEDKERLYDMDYTTCPVGRNDWYIRSGEVDLDHTKQEGVSKDGTVTFFDVPIVYAPTLSFPLDNNRKSGLLAPTYGTTATTGQDIAIPYYFNIAPNMDDTLTPRTMSMRGLQLGNEFRYMEPTFKGTLSTEYMQRDIITGTDRWFGQWTHQQELLPGLNFAANVQGVSDPNYL